MCRFVNHCFSNREKSSLKVSNWDDSWILYKNEKRMAYWLPREDPPAQPKPETHGRKVLLCCWWDARGMVHHELLTQGHTVTSAVYVDQLRRLAAALREKRRRMG